MPTYRHIIKRTWKICLQNKKWWLLGFWIALLGNGGEYDLLIKNFKNISSSQLNWGNVLGFLNSSAIINSLLQSFKGLLSARQPLTNFFILLMLGALIYLAITAQGTLINLVYKALKSKTQTRKKQNWLRIKNEWLKIRPKFWELLFTQIIFKGGGLILAFLITWPVMILLNSFTNLSFRLILLLIGFFVFIPLNIIISFLVKYTVIFIITKDKDPLSAWGSSWQLFRKNWLITGEIAIILFFLNLLFGLSAIIIALILAFPIIAIIALIVYPKALPDGYYFTIIAWILILILPALGSLFAAFQYSTWTALFRQLTGSKRRLYSKIVRLTSAALTKA